MVKKSVRMQILLLTVCFCNWVPGNTVFGKPVMPGEVNSDGAVDLEDSIRALKVTTNSPTVGVKADDVNRDDTIGIGEAIYLLLGQSKPADCDGAALNPVEIFDANDAPDSVSITNTSRTVSTPWGYEKPENSLREYPIVVNGCWGEGSYFTESIRKKYPAFYMTYQECSSDSDGEALAVIINTAVSQGLRIDEDRVYLTGFSKGGSGSYKLVRGFLSEDKLFAGILRLAGQSESVLPTEAVEKTSIWYHIGTNDTPTRVQVAQDAYDFVKNHSLNASASESSVTDTISGLSRTTKTLVKDEVEIMKYSVYLGMGHSTGPPYQDPVLFDWLFAQSLLCR